MYNKALVELYDAIYGSKSYKEESRTVLQIFETPSGGSAIDIGCGTLGHSRYLAKHFDLVFAVDTSSEMIARARAIAEEENLTNVVLHEGSIQSLAYRDKFQLAIAMFNVVNHILDLQSLTSFVRSVANSLVSGGVLIFDCWNGNSARVDVPYVSSSRNFDYKGRNLTLETLSETDFREGTVSMRLTLPDWQEKFGNVQPSIPVLTHRLWTPDVIEEVLLVSGFREVEVFDAKAYPESPDFRQSTRLLFKAQL